jgi:hypothetical protein
MVSAFLLQGMVGRDLIEDILAGEVYSTVPSAYLYSTHDNDAAGKQRYFVLSSPK